MLGKLNMNNFFSWVLLAGMLPLALSQQNCQMQQVFSGRYYGVDAELNDISTCLVIDLEDNHLNPGMIKTLADALVQTAPKIKELRFKDTKLDDAMLGTLLKAVEHRPSLKVVDFGYNSITAEGAKVLADHLTKNGIGIESVNLAVNSIGDEGAIALANALAKNQLVTSLTLRSNKIGEHGITALSKLLESNDKIVDLNLKYNKFEKTFINFIKLQNQVARNKALLAEKEPLSIKRSKDADENKKNEM